LRKELEVANFDPRKGFCRKELETYSYVGLLWKIKVISTAITVWQAGVRRFWGPRIARSPASGASPSRLLQQYKQASSSILKHSQVSLWQSLQPMNGRHC
jgi:ABC-type nitrate/sulfonate/bicarbonate transport system permease component